MLGRFRSHLVVLGFLGLIASGLTATATAADKSGFRDLVAKVAPATVVIELPKKVGSGFLVGEGTVVTNFHVVAGASEAKIRFSDNSSADVSGYVAVSVGRDLAILKFDKSKNKGPLVPVAPPGPGAAPQAPPQAEKKGAGSPGGSSVLTLADEHPSAGDTVLAFGAPKAMRGSVTDGIVSAVRSGDEVRELLKTSSGKDVYADVLGYDPDTEWIQTSAPISSGNSGGPLVNEKGEVVGIMTWTRSDGQNLNFAVAAKHVKTLLESAEKAPKPLTALPESKFLLEVIGDAKRTLEYWTERTRIEGDLYLRLERPKSWRNKTEALNFSDSAAKAARLYVADVSKMDIAGVDDELVDAVLVHVYLIRKLADGWTLYSESIRSRDNEKAEKVIADMDKADKLANDLMHVRFAELRQVLSKRYGVPFPHYEPDRSTSSTAKGKNKKSKGSDKSKSKVAGKADSGDEKSPASRLRVAKQLVNAKKYEGARKHLDAILTDNPDSDEAQEAKVLRDKIDGKQEGE